MSLSLLSKIKDHALWAIIGAVLTLVGPTCVSTLVNSVQDRLSMPMYIQRIEWVRSSSAGLPCGTAMIPFAPIVNEVVYWNLRIVHEQEANKHLYSDWLTSDKWNSIQIIPVPCSNASH